MACAAWVREGRVVCGASMHKCDEEEKQKLYISRWRTHRRR